MGSFWGHAWVKRTNQMRAFLTLFYFRFLPTARVLFINFVHNHWPRLLPALANQIYTVDTWRLSSQVYLRKNRILALWNMAGIARKLRIFYPIEIMISFWDKQRYVQRKHLIPCLTPNQMTCWLKTTFIYNFSSQYKCSTSFIYKERLLIGGFVFPVPGSCSGLLQSSRQDSCWTRLKRN